MGECRVIELVVFLVVIGGLVEVGVLSAWFGSGIRERIYRLVSVVSGEGKAQARYMKKYGVTYVEGFVGRVGAKGSVRNFVMELLSCEICLSFHVGLWYVLGAVYALLSALGYEVKEIIDFGVWRVVGVFIGWVIMAFGVMGVGLSLYRSGR